MINEKNNPKIKFGITEYFHKFISYIESERVFGVQFHPEKSQNNGNKFLEFFLNWKKN